jgi:Clp amino terminal domain, pathogenicity island component
MGDRRIGTEHLLVALLEEPDVAAAMACGPQQARAALHELDRAALARLGIEPPAGAAPQPPPALDLPTRPSIREVFHRHLRLTPVAKRALSESSRNLRRGRPHPGPGHVMAALLELPRPDPAAELFDTLGIDIVSARERLQEPGQPR